MKYLVGILCFYSIVASASVIEYEVQETPCTSPFNTNDVVTIKDLFSGIKYDVIDILPSKILGSSDVVLKQENSDFILHFDSSILEPEKYYLFFLKETNKEKWLKITYCNRKINDNVDSFSY
jgi:hypothetical protein